MNRFIQTKFGMLLPLLAALPMFAAAEPAASDAPAGKVFNVRQYGAKGDGQTLDTAAFQSTLDACATAGGGKVEVPAGTYLIQPIVLKGNNLTLQVDDGATVQGTDNFADYSRVGNSAKAQALISGQNLTNLTLTGPGVVDGAGMKWWLEVRAAKKAAKAASKATGEAREKIATRSRPHLVDLTHCSHLRVENLTLQNSPEFHLVPKECADVTIDGVTIRAPEDAPNTDAIDPYNCQHLTITRSVLDVGDDNIALKSGSIDPAHPDAACADILVEACTFQHGHGLSIGSEVVGGIQNLTVRNCVFMDTVSGIRIKSARGRGGLVAHCTYSDLTMNNVRMPVDISCYYQKGADTDTAEPLTPLTPRFTDIHIHNLSATGATQAGRLIGLPESRVDGFELDGVTIASERGFELKNAKKVKFKKVGIASADGHSFTMQSTEIMGLGGQ